MVTYFTSPAVVLFLKNFMLTVTTAGDNLSMLVTGALVTPFNGHSRGMLLKFVLVANVFSVFVSGATATTVVLAFLAPMFGSLPTGKGKEMTLAVTVPVKTGLNNVKAPVKAPPGTFTCGILGSPTNLGLKVNFKR